MSTLTDFLKDDTMVTENQKEHSQVSREYKISEVAANEWKSFAMYTVESRAIPNMIDGLKPVQRFLSLLVAA
jgi:DNA gyrase/topoisomerase IV subunit A